LSQQTESGSPGTDTEYKKDHAREFSENMERCVGGRIQIPDPIQECTRKEQGDGDDDGDQGRQEKKPRHRLSQVITQ
jgi:hypothetical protein